MRAVSACGSRHGQHVRAVSALVLRVVGVVSMSSVYFIQSQSGYPLQIIKG